MSIPHHSIPLALFSLLGALYCFRGGVCQNTAAERGAMVDMKQKVPVNKNAGRMPELAQIGKHPEPFENPLRLQKLSDPPNLDFGRAGLPAFRLGEDVRLPAAIMADADPRSLDGSSVVSEANRMIIGWFYGEIAIHAANKTRVADEPNEASAGISIKEAADTTVEAVEDARIIGADKDVLTLRRNADELYRVLFGDNAFNQQSMNSALEVTLPPLTGE